MMKKILIGVTAAETCTESRNSIRHILNKFELQHLNIQQKIIDAAAIILRISPEELMVNIEPLRPLPFLQMSASELKKQIRAALCTNNQYYLIDSLDTEINAPRNKNISQLFNGHIVSGITTNEEADYIRSHGGVMLHIINNNDLQPSAVDKTSSDLIHTANFDLSPKNLSLRLISEKIAEKYHFNFTVSE